MNQEGKTKLVIICGPTGVGKTSLALKIAPKIRAEIISADSGQVYRGLNIGTAKPTLQEQQKIRCYCLDLFEPTERGDAARYCQYADQAVQEILSDDCRPLVVGGAGLYLRTLLHGIVSLPGRDPELRQKLEAVFEKEGGESLHKRLQLVDPTAAQRIHPHDPTRLIRALEVYELTGRPISEIQAQHRFQKQRYASLKIGLQLDRRLLYERIHERVETMVAQGWLDEVKSLADEFGDDIPALTNIGYRELLAYHKGRVDWKTCVDKIKQNTRRFAKRQFTWFRKDPEVEWFSPENEEKIIERILQYYEA